VTSSKTGLKTNFLNLTQKPVIITQQLLKKPSQLAGTSDLEVRDLLKLTDK